MRARARARACDTCTCHAQHMHAPDSRACAARADDAQARFGFGEVAQAYQESIRVLRIAAAEGAPDCWEPPRAGEPLCLALPPGGAGNAPVWSRADASRDAGEFVVRLRRGAEVRAGVRSRAAYSEQLV